MPGHCTGDSFGQEQAVKRTRLTVHGSEGKIEIGIAQYDDPFQDNTRSTTEQKDVIHAPANIRCDVFHYLRYGGRKPLLADHQWAAGRRISMVLLPAERTARALDTVKEPVCGGGAKMPTMGFVENMDDLARAMLDDYAVRRRALQKAIRDELGRQDYEYITWVVEHPDTWIAQYDNGRSPWERKWAVYKLRGVLDKLAAFFGYSGKSRT